MPAAGFELSDRELLSVFSRNLRLLTNGITSISALCQSLDINRVQFNRYLSGEATPRPLILRRICRHFGVDARILIDPLESLPSATRQSADAYRLRSTLDAMDPVDASVLPDGLYAEWKYSLHVPGEIKFHVLQVRTEDGLRKTRVKSVNHVDPHIEDVLRSRR